MILPERTFESNFVGILAICTSALAIVNIRAENLFLLNNAGGLIIMIDPPPPFRPFSPLLFINLILVWDRGKISTILSVAVLVLVLLIYGNWYYDSYQIEQWISIGRI